MRGEQQMFLMLIFSKAIIIYKLTVKKLDKWTVNYIENLLSSWAQGTVISDTKFIWRQVTSGVPQGSILQPVPSNIFINDLDPGTERTLSKFLDRIKLWKVAGAPHERAVIQRDVIRLENWAMGNLMKLNKRKCQDLYLWKNKYWYLLGAGELESRSGEKGLRVLVENKLTKSNQYILVSKKASSSLDLPACWESWSLLAT